MAKVGVLGPRQRVMAFRALGIDTVFAEDAAQAQRAFEKMEQEEYALIYLAEEWLTPLRTQVERCADRQLPAVILLPSADTSGSAAMEALRSAVIRAVGADIA